MGINKEMEMYKNTEGNKTLTYFNECSSYFTFQLTQVNYKKQKTPKIE